jgi:Arc/MetJ family transcription regulator
MRTTLNLKAETVSKVMEITGAKNRSEAVNQALEAFVQENCTRRLLGLRGKLHLEENWKHLREMELNEG